MSDQIRVLFNDPPIHCVDVCNTIGKRAIRIRPTKEGALLEFTGVESAALDRENLEAFADALSRLARGADTPATKDADD